MRPGALHRDPRGVQPHRGHLSRGRGRCAERDVVSRRDPHRTPRATRLPDVLPSGRGDRRQRARSARRPGRSRAHPGGWRHRRHDGGGRDGDRCRPRGAEPCRRPRAGRPDEQHGRRHARRSAGVRGRRGGARERHRRYDERSAVDTRTGDRRDGSADAPAEPAVRVDVVRRGRDRRDGRGRAPGTVHQRLGGTDERCERHQQQQQQQQDAALPPPGPGGDDRGPAGADRPDVPGGAGRARRAPAVPRLRRRSRRVRPPRAAGRRGRGLPGRCRARPTAWFGSCRRTHRRALSWWRP